MNFRPGQTWVFIHTYKWCIFLLKISPFYCSNISKIVILQQNLEANVAIKVLKTLRNPQKFTSFLYFCILGGVNSVIKMRICIFCMKMCKKGRPIRKSRSRPESPLYMSLLRGPIYFRPSQGPGYKYPFTPLSRRHCQHSTFLSVSLERGLSGALR